MTRLVAIAAAAILAVTVASPALAQQCKGTKVWCKTLKRCTYADACPKKKPPKPRPRPVTRKHTCPDDMVRVPAGMFVMGADPPAGDPDEAPKRQGKTSSYCLDRTEVTVKAFLGRLDGPGAPAPCGDHVPWEADLPMACVTWAEAAAHCRALGKRLPTAAEWERAARGDVGATWPWGEAPATCERARTGQCERARVPVGSHPEGASPHGALDMVGNVAEWVADWYAEPALRAVRGGSYAVTEVGLRPSDRDGERPDSRHPSLGFRCAK